MKKTLLKILAAALLLPFLFQGAVYAQPMPDLNAGGSIRINLIVQGERLNGGSLAFYRVGEITSNHGKLGYTLTEEYKNSGVDLKQTDDDAQASLLEEYIMKEKYSGAIVPIQNGKAVYDVSKGKLGLYLVIQNEPCEGSYACNPFFISVPEYDQGYDYIVDAAPKMGIVEPKPPVEPEVPENPENPDEHGGLEEDDDNGGGNENGNTDDDSLNSGGLDGDNSGGNKLPQTGLLLWPVPVLAGSGLGLFALGRVLSRKQK